MLLFLKRSLVQIPIQVSSKGVIVESKSMTKLPTNCTGIMLNNISDNVKQIFNSVLVNSCSKIGI